MSSQFTNILNLPNPKDEYTSNFEKKNKLEPIEFYKMMDRKPNIKKKKRSQNFPLNTKVNYFGINKNCSKSKWWKVQRLNENLKKT